MYRVPVGASRGLRWGCLSLAAVVALLAVTTDPADARGRRKRYVTASCTAAHRATTRRYAAIVVDANTGAVLHAAAPDALRHPASLTKIMTLYLLFERLEAGKIKLDTPMEVSEHAAAQAPTKLGLRPGQTLDGRGRDQGPGHQVGQRRRRRDRRSARRQRRRIRPRR